MAVVHSIAQVIARFFRALGVLRSLLVGGALVVMVFAPGAGAETVYTGAGFVETIVMPVLAPLFLTGLLLDALMCRILRDDPAGGGAQRLRLAMRTELVVALLLVIAYAPFFLSLSG